MLKYSASNNTHNKLEKRSVNVHLTALFNRSIIDLSNSYMTKWHKLSTAEDVGLKRFDSNYHLRIHNWLALYKAK